MNGIPFEIPGYFGADAVMYIWLQKWSTSYYVIAGNVSGFSARGYKVNHHWRGYSGITKAQLSKTQPLHQAEEDSPD